MVRYFIFACWRTPLTAVRRGYTGVHGPQVENARCSRRVSEIWRDDIQSTLVLDDDSSTVSWHFTSPPCQWHTAHYICRLTWITHEMYQLIVEKILKVRREN